MGMERKILLKINGEACKRDMYKMNPKSYVLAH